MIGLVLQDTKLEAETRLQKRPDQKTLDLRLTQQCAYDAENKVAGEKNDIDEFIECYKAGDPSKRCESGKQGRWKSFTYEELVAREKTNLDIFWLKDESLEDTDKLPAPVVLAQEIVEQLGAALEEFREVANGLGVAQAGEIA